VVSLSTSAPGGKLTREMVKESLLSEKARRKEKGESSSEVLVSEKQEGRGRSKVCILRVTVKRIHLGKNLETGKMSNVITVTRWVI